MVSALASGQSHLSERVYISTDKDVYVSGDDLFFSAFCIDAADGGFSGASATAYLEICSPEGPVQTAKVALKDGRGGGVISLKNTIPTGNYELIAYTAQCFNEDDYDFESGSKVLSIINPFTTDRSPSGVTLMDDAEYGAIAIPDKPSSGSLKVDASDSVIRLTNDSDRTVSLSVSVSRADGIKSRSLSNPVSFKSGIRKGSSFSSVRELEYDGEIVRARVFVPEGLSIPDVVNMETFLSIPGRDSDFYSSEIGENGYTSFYTRNIYGDVEAVFEANVSDLGCHLEMESPFKSVKATGLEALPLSASLEKDILRRSVGMQVQKAVSADSLYGYLPLPEDLLLGDDGIEYILDDYTRFPLMEEVFIEFISEARVRRQDDKRAIFVILEDSFRSGYYGSQLPVLTLLDGVPVTDHERILEYDPLLVEKITVYPHTYKVGNWIFGGVVSFATYKHNLPSFEFNKNTRVVDFQGVSFPAVSYAPSGGADAPDMRETVLWHPMVEIGPGESRVLNYSHPAYEGGFDVVVEGFDSEGTPQYVRTFLRKNTL